MGRAELRRKQKEQERENKRYILTRKELEQLEQRIRTEEQNKAKEEFEKRTKQIANEVFNMMLVIPTNVLIEDYWSKTARKRIPKFVNDCISLFESYTGGVVEMEEMLKLTEEYSGVKLMHTDGVLKSWKGN